MSGPSVVLLGSTITALAVAREAQSIRLRVTVFDTRVGPALRTRVARREIIADGDDVACLNRLTTLADDHCVLVATEDRWLRFLLRYRREIDGVYQHVLHPHNEALSICLDKAKFSAWCRAEALPSPQCWSVSEISQGAPIRYPLLLRPATTLHDRARLRLPKAVEVRSANELFTWLDTYSVADVAPVLSESLLDERLTQYSVPIARARGRILSFVARKLRPPAGWCRAGTYVELTRNPCVEELARQAVERLDFYGIGEVEILHGEDSGKDYLIEVNARPWLQYSMAMKAGYSLLGFALNLEAQRHAAPRSRGVRWIDFSEDLYVCWSRDRGMLRRREIGWFEYLRSLLKANAYARFSRRDWRPFLDGCSQLATTIGHSLVSLGRRRHRQAH